MWSPLWSTPTPHRRLHATHAHTSTHVALAHTHEYRRAYIYATHHALHVASSILSISALLDSRKSVPSTARANMRASLGMTGYQRSKQPASSLHRSPTLSQTVRGHGHSPVTVSRQSKICPIDRPRQHACKHRCDRRPKVGKLSVPSHNRSAIRSQTVRTRGLGPITVSRWPKIGRVDRPRQLGCKHRSDRITQDRQTARAVAPSLPDTLADCARQPAQSHHRFSTVENRPRRPPAPTCVQAS